MGSFKATPGLDDIVARMVAPEVGNVAKRVERAAKRFAPAVKEWTSMQDNDVRDTHVEAHGQQRPANLRYELTARPWDVAHGHSIGVDPVTGPNDPTSGLPGDSAQWIRGNTPYGCRCRSVLLPTAIAEKIKTGPTLVEGSRVRVVVSVTADKVVQAEFGDAYASARGTLVADGTRFMGRAVATVAATMQ